MRILFISHFLPYPPIGGDKFRIASLIDWLVDSGYEVSFLFIAVDRFHDDEIRTLKQKCREVYVIDTRRPLRRIRQMLGWWGRKILSRFEFGRMFLRRRTFRQKMRRPSITVRPIDAIWSRKTLQRVTHVIRSISERPHVVICEYITTSRCFELEELSGSLKILDAIEVMHYRMSMIEKGFDPWIACTVEEERRCLRRADVIMALHDSEANIFRQLVPDCNIISVGQPFHAKAAPQKECSPTCLMVGTTHDVNLEGLWWFQKNVWPLVLKEIEGAVLLVAGQLGEYVVPQQSVRVLGRLKDIDDAYKQAAVVIVPYLSGSSVKIKFLEALSRGKAVVTTKSPFIGICTDSIFFTAEEPVIFAHHVITLLKDIELRRNIEDKAFSFAHNYLRPELVYSPLKNLLEKRRTRERTMEGVIFDLFCN